MRLDQIAINLRICSQPDTCDQQLLMCLWLLPQLEVVSRIGIQIKTILHITGIGTAYVKFENFRQNF